MRLDYLSCLLTIASTVLIGRKCWEGWALACINSAIICIIGLRTEQLGFIPANVFCIVMGTMNLQSWRKARASQDLHEDLKLTQLTAGELTRR